MRLNVHTRSPFYCKHALCAGIIPLGYHLAAGSYVRESTFRWLIPDELRLIPFVTTAADMHPAARHEHMGSPSGRCSAPLGARLLPLEAKGFAAVVGHRHRSFAANDTNAQAFVRVSVRPLAGLVRRCLREGCRGSCGRQVFGSRDAGPRTRRGATVWAWQALRRRGGTGCGRGPCRACGDASRDRSFQARRGMSRRAAIRCDRAAVTACL